MNLKDAIVTIAVIMIAVIVSQPIAQQLRRWNVPIV